MFLVISPTKLGQFWWNLVHSFLNKFAIKRCKPHPTWTMSLHYLVKLEMLIAHVLPLTWYRKKLQNLSHRNCDLQIHQILIQLIIACVKYRKRRCKNAHHCSGRTETATENGVDQAGSHRHCGSHPSVTSSIAPDQWCIFYTPSCNIFQTLLSTDVPHSVRIDTQVTLWNGVTVKVTLTLKVTQYLQNYVNNTRMSADFTDVR